MSTLVKILSESGVFNLPALPFGKSELAPFISSEAFEYHHEKHHKAYVDNLNNLIKGTEFEGKNLKEIILLSSTKTEYAGIFNNAAQVFNHTFFWNSMKKDATKTLSEKLTNLINQAFGSMEGFHKAFHAGGMGQFGSGWVWLVFNKASSKLEIVKTPNAGTPITDANLTPLLTADVWEHAYYIDYRNKRADFLTTFLNHLINWEFVEENLSTI